MHQVADGDHGAFATLVDRHLKRAVALAQRISGNRSDAEELVQEAWLRVWTNAARWEPRKGSFRAWFDRIVVNLCIDRHRRPGFEALETAGDPADERSDALTTLARSQSAELLAAAMNGLPARQRAALALCYWEGASNIEAARTLNVSVGALESLLVRARRALRASLAPIMEHEPS